MCKQTIIELSRQHPNGQPIRNHLPKFIVTDCHEASLLEQTNLKMKINEFKYLRRLLNSAIILLCVVTLSVYPTPGKLKNQPDHGGNRTREPKVAGSIPTVVRLIFQLAWCGIYTQSNNTLHILHLST